MEEEQPDNLPEEESPTGEPREDKRWPPVIDKSDPRFGDERYLEHNEWMRRQGMVKSPAPPGTEPESEVQGGVIPEEPQEPKD